MVEVAHEKEGSGDVWSVSPDGQKRIEFARALFEKLEGISRQRTTIDEARRNFRILEMMGR